MSTEGSDPRPDERAPETAPPPSSSSSPESASPEASAPEAAPREPAPPEASESEAAAPEAVSPERSSPESAPPASAAEGGGLQDLMQGLNMVPQWARGDTAARAYDEFEDRGRGRDDRRGPFRGRDRRDRDRGGPPRRPDGGGRDRRPPQGAPDRRGGGGPPASRPPRPPGAGPREDRDGHPRFFRDEPRRFEPALPVDVSFLPDRAHLVAVVRQIHAARKAYPLANLAQYFLNKPEFHLVKFEARAPASGPPLKMLQCRPTQVLFLDAEAIQNHCLARVMMSHFDAVEQELEPPTGNFVCVGRCRSTGTLLGPPNHHAYNEQLIELHRMHFSHLPLDEYRKQIEIVREPEVVEQWRQQTRVQRLYRPKGAPEDAPLLRRTEAEARFLKEVYPSLVASGSRFVIPATAAGQIEDERLKRVLREAWTRESKFPLRMLLALRAAFKHMRLHLFKTGRNEQYVTGVVPHPLGAVNVIEPIRRMLDLVGQNPGWTPAQLLVHLHPGMALGSPEGAEALSPLRWLIEKGHVIEFHNGTLWLPTSAGHHPLSGQPARPAATSAAPDAASEPEPEAVPADGPEAAPETGPAADETVALAALEMHEALPAADGELPAAPAAVPDVYEATGTDLADTQLINPPPAEDALPPEPGTAAASAEATDTPPPADPKPPA